MAVTVVDHQDTGYFFTEFDSVTPDYGELGNTIALGRPAGVAGNVVFVAIFYSGGGYSTDPTTDGWSAVMGFNPVFDDPSVFSGSLDLWYQNWEDIPLVLGQMVFDRGPTVWGAVAWTVDWDGQTVASWNSHVAETDPAHALQSTPMDCAFPPAGAQGFSGQTGAEFRLWIMQAKAPTVSTSYAFFNTFAFDGYPAMTITGEESNPDTEVALGNNILYKGISSHSAYLMLTYDHIADASAAGPASSLDNAIAVGWDNTDNEIIPNEVMGEQYLSAFRFWPSFAAPVTTETLEGGVQYAQRRLTAHALPFYLDKKILR